MRLLMLFELEDFAELPPVRAKMEGSFNAGRGRS